MLDADWEMSVRPQDQDVKDCETDYFSTNGRASYFDVWYNILKEDLDDALSQTNLPLAPPEMWQLWSQKYTRGQYHGVHNHGFSNLSCVLYVVYFIWVTCLMRVICITCITCILSLMI